MKLYSSNLYISSNLCTIYVYPPDCFWIIWGELAGHRRTSTRGADDEIHHCTIGNRRAIFSSPISSWWNCSWLLNDFFFWVSGYHVCDMYQYDIVKRIIWIANKASLACLVKFPSPLLRASIFPPAGVQQLSWSPVKLEWLASTSAKPDGFVHSHSRNLTTSNHVMCASSRNTNIPPRPNPQPPIMYKYRIDWKGQIRHLVCALICKEFGDEFDPLNPWEDRRLGWDDIISIHSPHGWSFPKSGRGDHHPIHSRGGRSVKQNFRVFCVKTKTLFGLEWDPCWHVFISFWFRRNGSEVGIGALWVQNLHAYLKDRDNWDTGLRCVGFLTHWQFGFWKGCN